MGLFAARQHTLRLLAASYSSSFVAHTETVAVHPPFLVCCFRFLTPLWWALFLAGMSACCRSDESEVILRRPPMPGTSVILNYEPSARRRRWRRFVKPLAIAFCVVVCVAPTSLAVYAWVTHFVWLRSGAYARNSFPMGAFAREMTWMSAGCVLAVAIAWSIAVWWLRRSAAR